MVYSLSKLFGTGELILATANNSLESSYNPTVVIYVVGLFLNSGIFMVPFVKPSVPSDINVGLLV